LLGKHVNFDQFRITHCGPIQTRICEYDGEANFPIDKYLRSYEEYVAHNDLGLGNCKYCHNLKDNVHGELFEFSGFKNISINCFDRCQLNCLYCNKRNMKKGNSIEPYPILPVIKNLYENNLIDDDCVIHWDGGEITLYGYYAEAFSYILEKGMFQKAHTNCVIFSKLFVDALKVGKLEMLISIDSGKPETYKKVKGIDCFDKVWGNIEQYCVADVSGHIAIKYHIMQHNMNKRDYLGFVSKCVQCGVKKIIISVDFHTYKPHTESYLMRNYINAARMLYTTAVNNNLLVDFNFWLEEDIQRITNSSALTTSPSPKDVAKQLCPPILYLSAHKIKTELQMKREERSKLKAFLNNPKLRNTRYDKAVSVKAVRRNRTKINQVLSLLHDDRSKEIFQAELTSREKMKDLMPTRFVETINNQYFDREIIKLGDREIFVDAGAYDGATTALFMLNANSPHTTAYLFEPDPTMHETMLEKISQANYTNLEFFKAGLSDKTATERFSIRPIGSSRIDPLGEEEISTVALDDLIEEATFIKMDIEGGEIKALLGARNIISKCKPKLAIAIYHNINDLWEVPLLIHSFNPEYKLYVRKYQGAPGYFLNEVVCYAIL